MRVKQLGLGEMKKFKDYTRSKINLTRGGNYEKASNSRDRYDLLTICV